MNQVNPYAPPTNDGPSFDPSRTGLDSSGAPLASRMSRFGASLLDGLVLLVVIVPVQYALGVYDNFPNAQQVGFVDQLLGTLAGVVAYAVINWRFLAKGQTLGKKAVGIRIVHTDGSPVSPAEVVLKRYIPYAALALIPVVGMILSLINALMIFGSSHRCGHDLIAGTKVVEAWDEPV